MKVKKLIGSEVNGFKIIDTYKTITENGKPTRKVLLECAECGRIFERNSGADFKRIKCKCKCKYLEPKKEKYHYIEWNGERYILTDFCEKFGIKTGKFAYRLKQGLTVEEAIQKEFLCKCEICGAEFISEKPFKRACSKSCKQKLAHIKKYKNYDDRPCVICGKLFKPSRENAKTCSYDCRRQRDGMIRSNRYKSLRAQGRFDDSITTKSVYIRYAGICQECGKPLSFSCEKWDNEYPSIDHVIPLSKGGSHEWDNVQLLCRGCNIKKSNSMPEEVTEC